MLRKNKELPTLSKSMKTVLHPASSRGHADHGWLNSYHTFSFAQYYNPDRMHFGTLRVLNDDVVQGARGFGEHPHENMEIISIPLSGDLEHKDSMGNTTIIREGDVQIMSAGTGIFHSEYNKNKTEPVNFLQIWVFPKIKNITPRYDQKKFLSEGCQNKWQEIVTPNANSDGVQINQDAWFHLGKFEKDIKTNYIFKNPANGLYVFVLTGNIAVGDVVLGQRDGLAVTETDTIEIETHSHAEILLMEIPMN